MIGRTLTNWRARLLLTGFAALLAMVGLAMTSPPAEAGFFVGIGVPCCGYYYGPGPYYGYPPPYYYAPPAGYYPPPPGYYPPAGAPSAYTPPPAPNAASPSAMATPMPRGSPQITYTSKPAFTNAAGQTCREYKTTDATAGRDVFGTACREADGQWRVVN
jgi:hypothetical protein